MRRLSQERIAVILSPVNDVLRLSASERQELIEHIDALEHELKKEDEAVRYWKTKLSVEQAASRELEVILHNLREDADNLQKRLRALPR